MILVLALVASLDTLDTPAAEATPAPATEPAGSGEARAPLDFELLPPTAAMPSAEALQLEHQVRVRRSMLQWHQGLGIATVLLLAATVIAGQLDYTDRFGGGQSSGQYEAAHTLLEAAATVSFAADGLLALCAPVPYPKKDRSVSTVTVHKFAMLAATLGFASEVPLGIITVAREGHADQNTLATVHLAVGYFTAAAVATGVAALGF